MQAELHTLFRRGRYAEALSLYPKHSGDPPSAITLPLILKACGKLGLLPPTQQIHALAAKAGILADTHTATALTDAYMKLGEEEEALQLLTRSPNPALAAHNAAIAGLRRSGRVEEAVALLQRLLSRGLVPNAATIAGLLPGIKPLNLAVQLHGLSLKLGLHLDDFVSSSLISVYCSFNDLASASRVLQLFPTKTVVLCNSFISGLLRNGLPSRAVSFFKEMLSSPWQKPNNSTLVTVVAASSRLSDLHLGRQIHAYLAKRISMEEDEALLGAALVNMYFNCGSETCALFLFESLSQRGLPLYNSMIAGSLRHGRTDRALELVTELNRRGLGTEPATWNLLISAASRRDDCVTAFKLFRSMLKTIIKMGFSAADLGKPIASVLQACSANPNLKLGKEIHGYALKTSLVDDDFVLTALVAMYMKCGDPSHGRGAFDQRRTSSQDAALWNAMISGYGMNGQIEAAMETLRLMERSTVKPNEATFLCAISVCSHAGEIDKGYKILMKMKAEYDVSPRVASCVVDLMARAGRVEEAKGVLREMMEPTASAFYSLLGGAACYGKAEAGELAAEKLLEMDPGNPVPVVMLSNIYAERGRWREVERMREMVGKKTTMKTAGFSRITGISG
ncbi:pentatricopeptide repeat-containing protein At2g02750-like [Wolffia australiana]